jgi:hypothetical protein
MIRWINGRQRNERRGGRRLDNQPGAKKIVPMVGRQETAHRQRHFGAANTSFDPEQGRDASAQSFII